MPHGATITIVNYADSDLRLLDNRICHGKYSNNTPPAEIKNKEQGGFRVSPVAGGSVGPKGWVYYQMAVCKGNNSEIKNSTVETIRIFWDHPVGKGRSRYEVSSAPYMIDFELQPSSPTGTEQNVTIVLKKVIVQDASIIGIDCDH